MLLSPLELGELLLTRAVHQFRRAFKRNDKVMCHAVTRLLAHLAVVGHVDLALQLTIVLQRRRQGRTGAWSKVV